MRSGLFLLLLLADALWPCSVEILSIEFMTGSFPNIVVGEVESVEGEIVEGYDEDSWEPPPRALTGARFRVQEALKGEIAPGVIDLVFDPGYAYSTCHRADLSFQPGRWMVLMLPQPPEGMPYRPHLTSPAVIGLSSDYVVTPLYQYLSKVMTLGRSPIQISFRGPDRYPLQAPLALELVAQNDLDLPIEVQVMGDFPVWERQLSRPVLRLEIPGIRALGALPMPLVIASHQQASLDLGAYFETANVGISQIDGILCLATADNGVFWDRWNTPAWRGLYRFTVDEETGMVQ
jgi:hypothetical protein